MGSDLACYIPFRIGKFHDNYVCELAIFAKMLFEPLLCGVVV